VALVVAQGLRVSWAAVTAAGPARPADGLLLCAAGLSALLTLWLVVALVLSVLSALPGAVGHVAGRGAGRIAPTVVRRLAALALGAGLAVPLVAGTASAGTAHDEAGSRPVARGLLVTPGAAATAPAASWPTPTPSPRAAGSAPPPSVPSTPPPSPDEAPDAAWTPSPPDRIRLHDPEALDLLSRAPAAGHLVDEAVVVRRGDSLWSITARYLGPSATADEIAREWPRWHDANHDVIGDDPDLIRPGQVLHPPASSRGT
jgi:nucleoid-associated protein YgaU